MNGVKPGNKTSEFILVLAGLVLGSLVLFGVVAQAEADQFIDFVKIAIEAASGFALAVLPILKYIESRTRIKEAALKNGSE